MTNSATIAVGQFKNQVLGGLMTGTSGMVEPRQIAPSSNVKATVAAGGSRGAAGVDYLSKIRESSQKSHQSLLKGIQRSQEAEAAKQGRLTGASPSGYQIGSTEGSGGSGGRGQYGLTVPAAQAFNAMSAHYAKRWGSGLTVNSGGRTYAEQVEAYRKYQNGGPLAAKPGTSLHESGIAVDIGGPIASYDTAQHLWLQQNAAQFGWYWVGANFGEPWHWEYHPNRGR